MEELALGLVPSNFQFYLSPQSLQLVFGGKPSAGPETFLTQMLDSVASNTLSFIALASHIILLGA